MTPAQFKRWIVATLQEIEGDISDRAPVDRYAAIVAECKQHAYTLGLHDFALTLPDTETVKTALTAANQLRRCLAAITTTEAAPTDAELLTVKQASQRFQMGERTIYRLIETGSLTAVRVGRSVRVRPAEFERYLEEAETVFR